MQLFLDDSGLFYTVTLPSDLGHPQKLQDAGLPCLQLVTCCFSAALPLLIWSFLLYCPFLHEEDLGWLGVQKGIKTGPLASVSVGLSQASAVCVTLRLWVSEFFPGSFAL